MLQGDALFAAENSVDDVVRLVVDSFLGHDIGARLSVVLLHLGDENLVLGCVKAAVLVGISFLESGCAFGSLRSGELGIVGVLVEDLVSGGLCAVGRVRDPVVPAFLDECLELSSLLGGHLHRVLDFAS